MLSRQSLIENMATVEAALADNDLVPVMSHFWFTGRDLLAYNETIGISVPCETGFRGAVPHQLLDLLKSSKAKECEFVEDGASLLVKAGSSKFKIATLPPEDFLWEMERLPKNLPEVDGAGFVRALGSVMRSAGKDKGRPIYQGVTVIQDKDDLLLYSTDRDTISYAWCKGKIDTKLAILPLAFCKAVLTRCEKAQDLELEINNKFALLRCEDTSIYGLLVDDEGDGGDFVGLVDGMLGEVRKDEWVEIPEKLDAMLDRAVIIMRGSKGKTRTKASVRDGKLRFFTEGDRGEVEDFTLMEKHPDCEATIDPARVREGLDYEQMAITANAVIFKTPGLGSYLISGTDD